MRFKIKEILAALLLSLLIFSISVSAQTNKLEAEWVLSTLSENGKPIPLIFHNPDQNQLKSRLSLRKNSFSMTGACNAKDGKYTANTRGKFEFVSIRSQIMYCGNDSMKVDEIVSGALLKVKKYQIKNKILTLQDNTGTIVLIFNYFSPDYRKP
jgi:heat shock protein HslJ